MYYYPINITKVLNNQTIIIKNKNKKTTPKKRDCKSVAVWVFFRHVQMGDMMSPNSA